VVHATIVDLKFWCSCMDDGESRKRPENFRIADHSPWIVM
jgi:hypothetical protein